MSEIVSDSLAMSEGGRTDMMRRYEEEESMEEPMSVRGIVDIESDGRSDYSVGVSSMSRNSADSCSIQSGRMSTGLNFSKFGFYGRENETRIFLEVFDRMRNKDKSEILFVHGAPRVGKSTLVESFRETVTAGPHGAVFGTSSSQGDSGCDTFGGYFIKGKFYDSPDLGAQYSAFNTALTDLCDLILQSPEKKTIQEAIEAELNPNELQVLSGFITNLGGLFSLATAQAASGYTRLGILVKKFLNAVATRRHPVVLALDDLQWAEGNSLEIVQDLISDSTSCHVLVVGSFRNTDENFNDKVQQMAELSRLTATSLEVEELSSEDINLIVADLLHEHDRPSTVMPLTEIVLGKTGGSLSFALDFLKVVEENGMLKFDPGQFCWRWDLELIQSKMDVSENVVRSVESRIPNLPSCVLRVLIVASCLGFNFNVEILRSIVAEKKILDEESPDGLFEHILLFAVEKEIIEEGIQTHWKFTHDRIQQALYEIEMYPGEGSAGREKLHLAIGSLLQGICANDEEASGPLLYLAVDQSNQGAPQLGTHEELVNLARLNATVSERAAQTSLFGAASKYCGLALKFVDLERLWQTDYDFVLGVLSSYAHYEFVLGHFEHSQKLAKDVLQKARSFSDVIHIYPTLIDSIGSQGCLRDALRFSLEVLEFLECSFPEQPDSAQVANAFEEIEKLVDGMTDEMLMALPMIPSHDRNLSVLKILKCVAFYAYFLEEMEVLSLSVLKTMKITVTKGSSGMAPLAFAGYGMLQSGIQHRHKALRYGKLSLQYLKKFPDEFRESEPRSIQVAHSFCMHWESKLSESADAFLFARSVGTDSGDMDASSLSACLYVNSAFFTTDSYEGLAEWGVEYRKYTAAVGARTCDLLCLPYCQAVENLRGKSDSTVVLDGDIITERELLNSAKEAENRSALTGLIFVKLMIAAIFGDVQVGLDCMMKLGDSNPFFRSGFNSYFYDFARGLVWSIVAYDQRAAENPSKHQLFRVTRRLKDLSEVGVRNCEALYLFLRAEGSSIQGEPNATQAAYDAAITACCHASYRLFEALANERAGLYFNQVGDSRVAKSYFDRALDLYYTINANAKYEQLRAFTGYSDAEERGRSFPVLIKRRHSLGSGD